MKELRDVSLVNWAITFCLLGIGTVVLAHVSAPPVYRTAADFSPENITLEVTGCGLSVGDVASFDIHDTRRRPADPAFLSDKSGEVVRYQYGDSRAADPTDRMRLIFFIPDASGVHDANVSRDLYITQSRSYGSTYGVSEGAREKMASFAAGTYSHWDEMVEGNRVTITKNHNILHEFSVEKGLFLGSMAHACYRDGSAMTTLVFWPDDELRKQGGKEDFEMVFRYPAS